MKDKSQVGAGWGIEGRKVEEGTRSVQRPQRNVNRSDVPPAMKGAWMSEREERIGTAIWILVFVVVPTIAVFALVETIT